MTKPEPIEMAYIGTDAEPGVGITGYGLFLCPPDEPEPVKIADGLNAMNAAEVTRRWNAYPDLLALAEAVAALISTDGEVNWRTSDHVLCDLREMADAALARHCQPPMYVLNLARSHDGPAVTATLTEKQWRLIRFALERAGESV